MPRPEKVRLGEILLQQALLTEAQPKKALDEQRKLGRVFVEKGFVSEDQISTALARQLQLRGPTAHPAQVILVALAGAVFS